MSCDLILAPSFPALLGRLLSDVADDCKTAPLAAKWVVVPSSTAARFLRLQLAERARGSVLSGVRVRSLPAFIRCFSDLIEQDPGTRWSALLDYHLFRFLTHAGGELPQRLRSIRGGFRLLLPTFLDLADAGFGTDEIALLADIASDADLTGQEAKVLQLYAGWLQYLSIEGVPWEPLSLQRLPDLLRSADRRTLRSLLGDRTDRAPSVSFYGFYDLTDLGAQVLTTLSRRVQTRLYLPSPPRARQDHQAYTFVQSLLGDLGVMLGTGLRKTTELDLQLWDQTAGYFLGTFPDGAIGEQPRFLTYSKASGLRAEVIAAALQIRRWLDAGTVSPESITVVAPDAAPYLTAVREIFPDFGVPVRVSDVSLGPGSCDRALNAILRIWENRAPAEWIFAYLRDNPGAPCLQDVDIDEFETRIRSLGTEGEQAWARIADVSAEVFLTAAEVALVQDIRDLWLTGEQAETTAGEALAKLSRIRSGWAPQCEIFTEVSEVLESLPSDTSIPLSLLLEMCRGGVSEELAIDEVDKPGVLLVPLMRARGLTARAVVILGLASGRFPLRIEEDPLLSDRARARLSSLVSQAGHRLPIKTAASSEMNLLFLLLNTSADLVHWVIPETDETGRAVAPTPWVQRYLQRWERGTESRVPCDRLARGPAEQARFLHELDPAGGSFLPPGVSACLYPHLTAQCSGSIRYDYLLEGRRKRGSEPEWFGFVPEASFPSPALPRIIRVTELEKLSRCPFQFYFRVLAGLESILPLEFSEDLDATEWGSLLHSLFDVLLKSYGDTGCSIRQIAVDLLRDDARKLAETIRSFVTDDCLAISLRPPLLADLLRARLLKTVRGYWEEVLAGAIPEGRNVRTESRGEAPFPTLPVLSLSGQLDRLDERGGEIVVLDYKSGREPENLHEEIRLGFKLQPILYPWLATQNAGNVEDARFSYVFLGGNGRPKEVPIPSTGNAEQWLALLSDILQRGVYLPSSNETLEQLGVEKANSCQYCECPSLCRRFERGFRTRAASLLQTHLADRVRSFRGELGSGVRGDEGGFRKKD